MADYHASLTMAMAAGEVPEPLLSLEDLAPHYKPGESLTTFSRRNWISWAIQLCAETYGKPGLSFLWTSAAALPPQAASVAAGELESLLAAIRSDPDALIRLLNQDAWPADELLAILTAPASPWDPLRESDDGDDPPYLLSYLCALLALLRYATQRDLHVVFAQTPE